MVVGVTNMLNFDPGQEKSFILHKRLQFQEEFKRFAASVLISAFQFKIIMKKENATDEDISIRRSAYKRAIIEFQKAKAYSNILYEKNTPERKIEKTINDISDLAKFNLTKAQNTLAKLTALQELLKSAGK